MGKKRLVVIGIGLVILIIAVGIAYQNYEYAKQAKSKIVTLNAVIQQKDIKIIELINEIKVKQAELSRVSSELDNIMKVLNKVQAQINTAIEQPAAQVPQEAAN
ncbi:MAG: hypothetical protein V1670_01275 [Candidatus Omnitrophota bacterium]